MQPLNSAQIIAGVTQVLALIDRCNRTEDGADYSAAELNTTNAGTTNQYSLCSCFRSVEVAAVYPTAGELQRTFVGVREWRFWVGFCSSEGLAAAYDDAAVHEAGNWLRAVVPGTPTQAGPKPHSVGRPTRLSGPSCLKAEVRR